MTAMRLVPVRLGLMGTMMAVLLGAYASVRAFKAAKRTGSGLPPPGPRKQDPEELDKMLDVGVADSMAASDPPSVTQPDVHR